MRHEKDEVPILIDAVMKISQVAWNPSGNIFAVSGSVQEGSEYKAVVQFYSNTGNHLKTLRVPNADLVTSISFEGSGLRLVMGVGGSLYFANLKLDYKWCYMAQAETLVFGY